MAHYKTGLSRRYVSQEDLTEPIQATIKCVALEEVGVGDTKEKKWVVHFNDYECKAVVLNVTRCEAIAAIAGTPDVDKWAGITVQVSRGTTRYKGKTLPCVEISAPPSERSQIKPNTGNDDVPF